MSKKIFITGCAKSGTTLLLRMCYAFKNTEVLYRQGSNGHELAFNDFVNHKSTESFVFGKRHPPAILSNVLLPEFEEQMSSILSNDIGIVNVIRDGRDVVLSDGNYVKPKRWIETIKQRSSNMYGRVIDLEVRYEDLIRNPTKVQKQMEEVFGLQSKHSFTDYPDYVDDWVFEWNVSILGRQGKSNETNYGKRKLSEKSIGKDLEAYKDLCLPNELVDFDNCLKDLGYV